MNNELHIRFKIKFQTQRKFRLTLETTLRIEEPILGSHLHGCELTIAESRGELQSVIITVPPASHELQYKCGHSYKSMELRQLCNC
jgi:hypothetical protein